MLHRLRCGRQHALIRKGPKGHLVPKQATRIRTGTTEPGLLAYLAQSQQHDPIDAELPVLDDAPEDQVDGAGGASGMVTTLPPLRVMIRVVSCWLPGRSGCSS
jgi:hypothetical protein